MTPTNYRAWYRAYLDAGIRQGIPAGVPIENIRAWAHSMALIADEFEDGDDSELVE